MAIESTNIQARIAQIQAQIRSLQTGTTTARTSSTTSSGSATTAASSAAFQSALSAASTTTASTTATATGGKLNAAGIPEDLAKFGNGKVPASALASVGVGSHKLWAPAAAQFDAMRQDAAKVGVKIGVTDSYRSYDEQVDLAKRKGLYSQGGLAAKPGTSDHGWGMSMDLDLNDRGLKWMRDNAAKYGFDENVPRESWHWTFSPSGVTK